MVVRIKYQYIIFCNNIIMENVLSIYIYCRVLLSVLYFIYILWHLLSLNRLHLIVNMLICKRLLTDNLPKKIFTDGILDYFELVYLDIRLELAIKNNICHILAFSRDIMYDNIVRIVLCMHLHVKVHVHETVLFFFLW